MTRADRIFAFIERFIRVPEGARIGQPMELAPFQREFVRAVYDNPHGTSRAYLSIARKNGKTGLIAALLLAHLVGPEARQNTQIVSGAMSREQASIVFALAAKMIALDPDLANLHRVVDSRKEIFGLPMNVHYRALSAEGKTAHGLSPVLAILDEVGQVTGPHSPFIDAITTAQGAHDKPLLIAISTQAATDGDLFSIWLDDAAKSNDPHIISHVYAAPAECELMDKAAWRAANPALGLFRSEADLARQAAQAARMPSSENTFRNLVLNQRVSLTNPFMSKSVWEACSGAPDSLSGLEVYGGLDLSARTDLTCLVLIGKRGDTWHVHVYFWTPERALLERARRDCMPYDVWQKQGFLRTTPGASVDYAYVAREIADIVAELDVRGIAFDRWRMDVLKAEFDRLGVTLPLIDHGQGFKDMSPALDNAEAEFLNGRVRHGGHPVLTMCAQGAVVTRDPAGNRKLDKSKATARIDGMVALVMAFGAAGKPAEVEPAPKYELFFI